MQNTCYGLFEKITLEAKVKNNENTGSIQLIGKVLSSLAWEITWTHGR